MEIKKLDIENVENSLLNARKLSLEELYDYSKDLAILWDRISERLDKGSYFSTSMVFYLTSDNRIIARSNKPDLKIDCIVLNGNIVVCNAGGLKEDGHLNEFINESFLMPSKEYHVDGSFIFKTDNLGRTISSIENLTEAIKLNRGGHSRLDIIAKEKNGLLNDVGGHIIANNVNGPTEAINIVPMDYDFNNSGQWKSMELQIKDAVYSNKTVLVKKELLYKDSSMRPYHINVDVMINEEHANYSFQLPDTTIDYLQNNKNIDYIHPLTIISDRYGGCYSGGKYIAFNLEPWDVPREVDGNDRVCANFWCGEDFKEFVIGKGNSPEEAYYDLMEKMQLS